MHARCLAWVSPGALYLVTHLPHTSRTHALKRVGGEDCGLCGSMCVQVFQGKSLEESLAHLERVWRPDPGYAQSWTADDTRAKFMEGMRRLTFDHVRASADARSPLQLNVLHAI